MGREKEGRERNLTQRDSALELNQSSSVHNGGAFRKEKERGREKGQKTNMPWTEEEDDQLRKLVAEFGPKKWVFVASKMENKGGKQCRRRWQNYLNCDNNKQGGWSPEEDEVLMTKHKIVGNKWTEIAKAVGGRTDNAVKNRYAALIAKQNGGPASGGVKKKKPPTSTTTTTTTTTSPGGGASTKTETKENKTNKVAKKMINNKDEKKAPANVTKKPTSSTLAKAAAAHVKGSPGGTNMKKLDIKGGRGGPPGSTLSPFKGSDKWVKPSLSSLKVPSSSRFNGNGTTPSILDFSPLVNTPNFNLLTGAELELLKELNASFSPTASEAAFGFNTLTSDKNLTSGLPNMAPESPVLDMHQVLKWIIAVTPRGDEAGTKATPFAGVQPPPLSAKQAEFLKSSLEERLKTVQDTPTGDLPPNIPSFSKDELNTLLSALGETPRTTGRNSAMLSRLQNPFGRAT